MAELIIRTPRRPTVRLLAELNTSVNYPGHLSELELTEFEITGLTEPTRMRVLVGDVSADVPAPVCQSRSDGSWGIRWPGYMFFERWAGYCTVSFVDEDEPSSVVCRLDLLILPAKVTAVELDLLLEDLSQVEIGLILDVYGKTTVAASGSRPLVGVAPEYFLRRVATLLGELRRTLPEISRRPQLGYRHVNGDAGDIVAPPSATDATAVTRQPAGVLPSEDGDPHSFTLEGRSLVVDRTKLSATVPDLNTYEHRAMRWFLRRIVRGLGALQAVARKEYSARDGFRPHWWQIEDAPRMEPLLERIKVSKQYADAIDGYVRRHPALAAAGSFTPPLRPTAAFRRQPAYRRLYNLMREFGHSGEFRFSGSGERYKTQNLSLLFEYWASLKMLRYLSQRYTLHSGSTANMIDTERFIISLREGASALLQAGDGRWIRFRYEPSYVCWGTPGAKFGRLAQQAAPWKPDLTLEALVSPDQEIPDFMLVFDVKYKRRGSEPVPKDVTETAHKYLTSIGRFDTFDTLPRHSWIIYPSDREEPWTDQPLFDVTAPAAMKTVGAVPLLPGNDSTFVRTLDRLLDFCGLPRLN